VNSYAFPSSSRAPFRGDNTSYRVPLLITGPVGSLGSFRRLGRAALSRPVIKRCWGPAAWMAIEHCVSINGSYSTRRRGDIGSRCVWSAVLNVISTFIFARDLHANTIAAPVTMNRQTYRQIVRRRSLHVSFLYESL